MTRVMALQYGLLKRLWGVPPDVCSGEAYRDKSKLRTLLGDEILAEVPGKVVLDFGCGEGREAIELALRGARRVIGVDIREHTLEKARWLADHAGVGQLCEFVSEPVRKADLIISIDSFEHFSQPEAVLDDMYFMLSPGGKVAISFGAPWYHPYGGHLFSVFPWAHLVLSEQALIRWRADFKSDGATCFGEVAGGLNQMTIGRFERMIRCSPFRVEHLETVPIRKLRSVHCRWTREFTTSIVRCLLVK